MESAKQIKNQKLFAKRVKRGDFRKAITKTKKSELPQRISLERKWEKEAKNSKKIEYEKITKIKL